MAEGGPVIAAFCAEAISHVRTLLAAVSALRERGAEVHVFTEAALQGEVEAAGARFVDLYARYPREALEDDSLPMPQRNVTFAGVYGEQLAADVALLEADLVLYETFAVIGPVVARDLGLPYVNVMPHHASVPERAIDARRRASAVHTSERCLAAVERLRDVHGIADANPFYYMQAHSPHLNLYPEPREFLGDEDRAALEPLAFFGSLTPSLHDLDARPATAGPPRVLASFGTILWRYFEQPALADLAVLADETGELGIELTIGLGGHPLSAAARAALERPGVELRDFVDQRAELGGFDAFVTHHGLNSTHEAILHRVPMISRPLYGDQPALAARCRELGLATPLVDSPSARVEPGALGRALARLGDDRDGYAERLERALGWELETIAGRGEVIGRILGLSRASAA